MASLSFKNAKTKGQNCEKAFKLKEKTIKYYLHNKYLLNIFYEVI